MLLLPFAALKHPHMLGSFSRGLFGRIILAAVNPPSIDMCECQAKLGFVKLVLLLLSQLLCEQGGSCVHFKVKLPPLLPHLAQVCLIVHPETALYGDVGVPYLFRRPLPLLLYAVTWR